MIITRDLTIKINESNYNYFEGMGYDVIIGDDIIIPIELLSKGSQYKIKCQCDGCGLLKDVIFKNYVKYDNIWGFYYCRKCSEKKRKKSLQENHECDYPIQNEKIHTTMKKTMKKKRKQK